MNYTWWERLCRFLFGYEGVEFACPCCRATNMSFDGNFYWDADKQEHFECSLFSEKPICGDCGEERWADELSYHVPGLIDRINRSFHT